jgi:heme-degrading monooxygenase HmoA
MVTLTVQHKVADFDAWKVVFDEHRSNRKGHGLLSDSVLRSSEDPNLVLVLMSWSSAADAQGFLDYASLPEVMARAGVVGPPRIELYQEASV